MNENMREFSYIFQVFSPSWRLTPQQCILNRTPPLTAAGGPALVYLSVHTAAIQPPVEPSTVYRKTRQKGTACRKRQAVLHFHKLTAVCTHRRRANRDIPANAFQPERMVRELPCKAAGPLWKRPQKLWKPPEKAFPSRYGEPAGHSKGRSPYSEGG